MSENIDHVIEAMMQVGAGRFGILVLKPGMSVQDAYGELAQVALEAQQVDEAAAWDEGWAAAVRGFDLPDSEAGFDLDPNPYRLGERHEPEPRAKACSTCGTEFDDCTNRIHSPERRACCSLCAYTDTHDDPKLKPEPVAPQPIESDLIDEARGAGGNLMKSDLMGRFDFDGAEGIAFWIGDSDTEPITKVMFDELETLKAFIEHNLPGMFEAAEPDAATERELEAVKEHREKWMARAFSAEAERDAAVAAIERVRTINTGNNRALYGNNFEAGMAKALWLVKTALGGAPEPEEKP